MRDRIGGFFRTTFHSLGTYNYRVWASGAIVSNIGTWMQRTAQDWLVLTELTNHNATSLGIVVALQFGPRLVLLPLTGYATDYFDKRKLLYVTQSSMGLLALALGLLSVTGNVQLWEVYVLAFLQGCATAFDAPARQTFVTALVPDRDLANAIALNSTSFNSARMVGPALAGILIALIGTGWLFLINAASFGAVILSMTLMNVNELRKCGPAGKMRGGLSEGFRYVWRRKDLRVVMIMIFFVGTFALNFPIYLSTMCVNVFHAKAWHYGIMTSIMAVGSVSGALVSAWKQQPGVALITRAAFLVGTGFLLAAMMPSYWPFSLTLIIIGAAAQVMTTSSISFSQLSTEPAMRGRVVAILLALAMGCAPLGAPLVGWAADAFGPRWAMGIGALSGILAASAGLRYLVIEHRQDQLHLSQ